MISYEVVDVHLKVESMEVFASFCTICRDLMVATAAVVVVVVVFVVVSGDGGLLMRFRLDC